jgi:hypothetical protein
MIPTEEMVETFKQGWEAADKANLEGSRSKTGLEWVLLHHADEIKAGLS